MKSLVFFSLLMGASITATAQENYVGLTGGITHTDVSSNLNQSSYKAATGFSGGISYLHQRNNGLRFGADLLYQRRGYSRNLVFSVPVNPPMITVRGRYVYNYLALPLKAGYRFGNTVYAFANVGVMPALRINATLSWDETEYQGGVFAGESGSGINGRVFDLAGLAEIGGGYRITNRLHATITGGYQRSVTSNTEPGSSQDFASRHFGWNGSAGVLYQLAK